MKKSTSIANATKLEASLAQTKPKATTKKRATVAA